jgi:hypothetical protein
MKLNKTLLLAALAAGSLFVSEAALQAQISTNPPTPAATPGAGMRGRTPSFDTIVTTLNLTDDQKTKVKPVIDALNQKISGLRADASLTPQDRRTKMVALRTDTDTKLKTILTPDQFAKWQKLVAGGRIRPGGKAAPAAPPAGGGAI